MISTAKKITCCYELCKPKIALFSMLSSVTGFLLAAQEFRPQLLPLSAGVFFLASGAGALNQYQERDIDALMARTKERPVPSGMIPPLHALYFSIMLLSLGTVTLPLAGNPSAPVLGLFAVLWYNGVYTFLKRKTAFAVIPGALIGAVPPAIGWITGNGGLHNPKLFALCSFFFLWQVPHFWLLVLKHGEEYKRAGLPSMTGIFTKSQMSRIVFSWIMATAVACLLIASDGTTLSLLIRFFLLGVSLWLVQIGIRLLLTRDEESEYSFAFKRINLFMFFVITLLSVDKF
jgi:protoheme IX farnesyltransferase